jgi:hypothetical protein
LYFEVTQDTVTQGYVVTDFDINTTPGVSYVTVDPVPVRATVEKPEKTEVDKKEDFFWL